jgi:hypothetical protein
MCTGIAILVQSHHVAGDACDYGRMHSGGIARFDIRVSA